MTQPLLCVYHANCDDGFGAAWAVRHGRPDTEFFAAIHGGRLMPKVQGRDVVMVDFCYPLAIMEQLIAACKSMTVLDHHKSSMLDMAGFNDGKPGHPKCLLYFDMDKSGAMLAWQWFNKRQPAPKFIEYIQDRDLWTKALPSVDQFTAGLRSYPQSFEVWDEILGFNTSHNELIDARVDDLIKEGTPILRYQNQLVDSAVRNSFWVTIDVPSAIQLPGAPLGLGPNGMEYYRMRFRGANVIPAIVSEVGEQLAIRYGGTSLTWVQGFKNWNYQLRIRDLEEPAFDVSVVAKAMGGGGHHKAAGFKVPQMIHAKWEEPRSRRSDDEDYPEDEDV